MVTPDPASVESLLSWASILQDRVSYVVVENSISPEPDFRSWRESLQAEEFRHAFHPAIVRMEYRLPEIEMAARQRGATLAQLATRSAGVPELCQSSSVIRARSYRRRLHSELDAVREVLLP